MIMTEDAFTFRPWNPLAASRPTEASIRAAQERVNSSSTWAEIGLSSTALGPMRLVSEILVVFFKGRRDYRLGQLSDYFIILLDLII